VLIRARKPWVLARRRVLGWNVRFMMLLGVKIHNHKCAQLMYTFADADK